MIRQFESQVLQADEYLQTLNEELRQSGEELWQESAFGEQATLFCDKVNRAFEEVVPPVEGPRQISSEVVVDSWIFRAPIRFHAVGRWGRLKEFVQAVRGRYHPAPDYWRTIVPQRERRTVSAVDVRIPGGAGMTIRQNVLVKRPSIVETPVIARTRLQRLLKFLRVPQLISRPRWEAIRKSWKRLWGDLNVEAPLEPKLVDQWIPVEVSIPPVELSELSIPAQAYWKRRWELEAEVTNITGFMLEWNQRVTAQSAQAAQLRSLTTALQGSVAALPRPIKGQEQLQHLQKKMDDCQQQTEQHEVKARELAERMQKLLGETLAARKELLGQ